MQRLLLFMYKTNELTGNVYNDSEVTIKVKEDTRFCYAKNVFFLGKINNVIVSLRPFGPSLLTEMTHFHTLFSYTSAGEISTRFYTWSLKKVSLWRRASQCRSLCGLPPRDKKCHQEPILGAIYDLRNEHSYLMHTLACVQTSLLWKFKKLTEFIFIRSVRSVL